MSALEQLQATYGQVWDTDGLRAEFRVLGFSMGFVVVERKSDGVKGSLTFSHQPRYYYGWVEDE